MIDIFKVYIGEDEEKRLYHKFITNSISQESKEIVEQKIKETEEFIGVKNINHIKLG